MKRFFTTLFCAAALFSVTSCDEVEDVIDEVIDDNDSDDSDDDDVITYESYIYALNSGNYGSNNATLTSYNAETEAVVETLFADQNGMGLGDTAQDMLVFGDKIFISVYNSGIIFVTDLEGELVAQIVDDSYTMPRYLTSDDDYVYVSYYDGGVAKIDPSTATIVAKSAVSINPEQLVEVDGYLYITISGYNIADRNKVDVYDTATLTYQKSIVIVDNPTIIEADGKGNLYAISMGNYGYGDPAIYATLQKIEIATETVSVISVSENSEVLPSAIVMGNDDKLYIVAGMSNASTGWEMVGDIYAYDVNTAEISTFISDGTSVPSIYSISTDLVTGDVYVGSSSYSATGDMYIYNASGAYQSKFSVGINPIKAISLSVPVEEAEE
ncbi:MAG: hypothetical protein R3Y16_04970 [Rikenellaceae bacterium]